MASDPWKLMRWARDQAAECELTPTQGHVLLVLATYADLETGECHPRLPTIAGAIRRGERETTRALGDLRRLGLIERRGQGPGRAVVTRLLARDEPRPSDSRSAAGHAGDRDSRSAASRDSRPTTPETRGGPRPEQPGDDHTELTPLTPRKRGGPDLTADEQETAETLDAIVADFSGRLERKVLADGGRAA